MEKKKVKSIRTENYLFEIHALHRPVHAPDHVRHAAGYLAHRDGCLDAGADGVDAAG